MRFPLQAQHNASQEVNHWCAGRTLHARQGPKKGSKAKGGKKGGQGKKNKKDEHSD
jgi:hypothetical protein